MPRPEQIHFDDAEIGAVFLVPLHHHAAGHRRRFKRHHGIKLPLADHHAAGMLSQMTRQILHRFAQLKIFAQAGMSQIQAGIAEAVVESVVSIAIFPGGNRGGNFVQSLRIEAQRLAHFPPRHAIAISNDVGGHGRAAFTVAFVQILDNALALVAAGQIEIDVGPLAAFFRKKTLEKQFHADGIDGGDAQRIADGAVGGRASSLHQNVLLATEADQVPHDQKISGQLEFFDQRQFALNLAVGTALQAGIWPAIALLKPSRVRSRRKDIMVSPSGTGYFGNSYPRFSSVNSRREDSSTVLARASGRSAKSCCICCGDFRCRSELRASRRPAVDSVR